MAQAPLRRPSLRALNSARRTLPWAVSAWLSKGLLEGAVVDPETLATNAGLDPVDVVLAVEAKHRSGEHTVVNVEAEIDGGSMNYTIDAEAQEIMEPEAVVRQALKSATEAAIMVLRIDDVILMNKEKPMGPPMGM